MIIFNNMKKKLVAIHLLYTVLINDKLNLAGQYTWGLHS